LPEDTSPLRHAVHDLIAGRYDVALFTTGTQAWHLFRIAAEAGLEAELRRAFARLVVASVGPTTSEALRELALSVDLEPAHPKMGTLVREAAARSHSLLRAKPPA
jgi:uroporphyrinogen-III synthase